VYISGFTENISRKYCYSLQGHERVIKQGFLCPNKKIWFLLLFFNDKINVDPFFSDLKACFLLV